MTPVSPPLRAYLAAALLAVPAAAAPRLLAAGDGEAPLRLVVDGAGARVTGDGAGEARLALPAGGTVDAFAATRGGWLAAGSVPATGGRELALWSADAAGPIAALPPPPARAGAVRAFPVPLLHDGELVGLAWLEGEAADRFGVRASGWDGTAWSLPVAVAAPGKGSQLGLAGAVLADGSWLLAWSAFDGNDDEVVWSRRRGTRWSEPRPVAAANEVPDVTPALRPDGDGALLVWSRYDGNDYRLALARFAAGRWQPAEWAAGAGSILPRWEGETLTFRDAMAGAWAAARVDAADRLRVEATTAAPAEPRPVAARQGGALRLLFP
jgi:hypothetical protein